ncbi:hypothetical protein [Rhizobium sp. LCM 4573]|uniref:phage tail tube protein n=1 Tax=Rhizobium sp. LCM 4573 TaxID=1848291 RepID=UPI0008DA460D|nr:hypothetical protein [Rhizobium sp. LCM 4573]OHV83650.1 hypothetical protein LCM4573_05970 [Rhizobium sp. LCM 4573]
MANKFLPLTEDYTKYSLQGSFQPHGEEGAYKLGDLEALGYTPEVQEMERWSREFAEKTLVRTDPLQKGATISLTALSISDLVRAAFVMDDVDQFLEQAATTKTVTFTKFVAGRIYSTGLRDATVTTFDDGAVTDAIEFVEGTHYRWVGETGDFEWLSKTAGADGGEMEVSGAAITAAEGRQQLGLMANSGLRGKLTLWGSNEIGDPVHVEFWDVKLTPSGEVALQGGDDYTQMQFTGRVYADGTKPSRFRYGRMTVLKS